MALRPDHANPEDDPLEKSELARRLRRMEWPPAPPEVKKRVLQRIVQQHDADLSAGSGDAPGRDG